jgi:hypothetical protein
MLDNEQINSFRAYESDQVQTVQSQPVASSALHEGGTENARTPALNARLDEKGHTGLEGLYAND